VFFLRVTKEQRSRCIKYCEQCG